LKQGSGFVPGGGVALLQASRKLDTIKLEPEEQTGLSIVKAACTAPFRQIVENCGKDSALYLEEALEKGNNFGFNALTEQVEDLIVAQVIDPTKVVKNSLKYAASVAGIVLISEALITDAPEEEDVSA